MNRAGKIIWISVILALLLLVVLVGIWLWLMLRPPVVVAPASSEKSGQGPSGLGAEVYQKTQNPLQNRLPAVNPVQGANPIQNAYQNPF